VDVLYLLDRLDELVTTAPRVPLSSRAMIEGQEYLDIADQIRLTLPDELQRARRVLAEREQILAEAEERADRLVKRAEDQVANRVEDHAIVQAAEARAHALLDQAERDAQEVRSQADEYAYRVFSSLLNRLRQIEGHVEQGLEELRPDEARATRRAIDQ
jgi:cell division septum initiation protein DivIVA